MKYIIFKNEKSGLVQPVVFGEHTAHSQIVCEGAKPVSAGFCHLNPKTSGLSVSGESESLQLKSDPKDGAYLSFLFCDFPTAFFVDFERLDKADK